MELSRLAVSLILILILSFARAQVDCPPFNVSELGTADMPTQGGLIGAAIAAGSGDPSAPVSVQVHDSRIVCLTSGQTQDTYRGASVIVSYTCTGAGSECTGNPALSQFEFECVAGPTWAASVGGSASSIITTPPNGTLSTTLRTDCGVCVSPARSQFANITNNDQHCGSCNSACNVGLMRCFNRLNSGCCNFYANDMCVANCTSPLVPNSNFDCVVNCGSLTITNGVVIYNPQGRDQTLVGANATFTCNAGYTLSENNMRTCLGDGTWTGSNPTCDIVNCGSLSDPDNGRVDTPQGTTYNAMATYSCNSPYTLNGDRTRTCQADGTWSGGDPTCELECQNGGTFNAGTGICECPTSFTGIDCSEMVCHPQCRNGGTCDTSSGACQCPAGYSGSDCSEMIVTCDPPCMNGRCVDGMCVPCPDGRFGANCTGVCSPGCQVCVAGTTTAVRADCVRCEDGNTLDSQTNQCQRGGGCDAGCIAGAIIGALLGALLLAAITAAIIYALYKHFSTPATQLKKGDTEGLNGVAKDNPLYVDPMTVEEQVGEDAAAAVGDA